MFENFSQFSSVLVEIESKYNEDVWRAFLRASLRLTEAKKLKKRFPVVANLLCYIAIETLSNNLAYFRVTNGRKITDFKEKHDTEMKIKKANEFKLFLDSYCPEDLKKSVRFKKRIDNQEAESDFRDILHYLYQKNRSLIVHKGLFRDLDDWNIDIYIDEKGRKCTASIEFLNGNFNEWIHRVAYSSFQNFLLKQQTA